MVLNFAACGRTTPPCRKSTGEFNDFPLAQRKVHTVYLYGIWPWFAVQDLILPPGCPNAACHHGQGFR
jgi:hypothetical protein